MAAYCLGNFGSFKYAWSRHKKELDNENTDTVWVTKRYIPTDLRVNAPVPRHKLMAPPLPQPDPEWIPAAERSPYSWSRDQEEAQRCRSQPSTRCEEWSTLRQMLPSRGRPVRHRPHNWGTGQSSPPNLDFTAQKRFPHINSPMTRYVDELHLTNRLFKLH